jgi:hypothetical protein
MKRVAGSAIAADIASVKRGLTEAACRAARGRRIRQKGKHTCVFPFAFTHLEKRPIRKPVRIVVVGGVYMLFFLRNRAATKNVDIIPLDFPDTTNPNRETKVFRAAVNAIAKTYRLRRDWMNDVVAAFTPSLPAESLMLWRGTPPTCRSMSRRPIVCWPSSSSRVAHVMLKILPPCALSLLFKRENRPRRSLIAMRSGAGNRNVCSRPLSMRCFLRCLSGVLVRALQCPLSGLGPLRDSRKLNCPRDDIA